MATVLVTGASGGIGGAIAADPRGREKLADRRRTRVDRRSLVADEEETMHRRTVLGMLVGLAAELVAVACGSVARPGQPAAQSQGSPQPAGQSPFSPQQGTSVITFIIRPGADPQAVGRRIGGADASVSSAYPGRKPRENLPMGTLMRTYLVTIPPDQAQQALERAKVDPDVQIAWFGTHLGA